MKDKIETILRNALKNALESGEFKECYLCDFSVEVPKNPDHGHFASNIAMILSSSQKQSPRKVADILINHLEKDFFERVEIAGPGFINFFINREKWFEVLCCAIKAGTNFGRSFIGEGKNILIEFVSANPTGPLHLGHGRGAALGDTLSRIMEFCGYIVEREFYINDAGKQIDMLGKSVLARLKQMTDPSYPFPEDGYYGDYINDLAAEILKLHSNINELDDQEASDLCASAGKDIMLNAIKEDLDIFRVKFDNWFSEKDIYSSGLLKAALDNMNAKGILYEEDGGLWINTIINGDDKNRVLRKRTGEYTYFAADLAYHLEKYSRGYHRAVNIWGADHHGYIPRIQAALKSSGVPDNWLHVLITQLVKLWKENEEVKMSKRSGNFISLSEVCDEVGTDAVRFIFLSKSHDSALDFNMDLVKQKTNENPVFYVQYAHARIHSIFKKALEEGLTLSPDINTVIHRLELPEEIDLIRKLADFPALLQDIAKNLEPHRLTFYLQEIAAGFHHYFYMGSKNSKYRIVGDDRELSSARLALVEGLRIVLNNGLNLLGIQSPEQM